MHEHLKLMLRNETQCQIGRLHTDNAKNTGLVVVRAEDMKLLLDRLDELEFPKTLNFAVECPSCEQKFTHTAHV